MGENSWSKGHPACISCHSANKPHKGKGLCSRCYPIYRKLELISNWEFGKEETLVEFPYKEQKVSRSFFERVKKGLLMEYSLRRSNIQTWSSIPQGFIDGTTFEYLFDQICKHCKTRDNNLFHGYANIFDHTFGREQKQELYSLLTHVLLNIPWRPSPYCMYSVNDER